MAESSSCVKVKTLQSTARRIIPREKLYQDPDLFEGKDVEEYFDQSNVKNTNTNDWTRSNFKRAGENTNIHRRDVDRNNCIRKSLDKNLVKPVECTKAESMMMKMGWQGGGLGKAEEGILEPIVPHTSNIHNNSGLGHDLKEEKTKKAPAKSKKPGLWSKKEYFKINTLLYILDFVKDDRDIELVFDCKLTKAERKIVHNVVDNDDNKCTNYESNAELDLYNDVARCNKLELKTESEGEYPNRYLCIYKEAPDYVYLVSPKDFENVNEVIDNDTKSRFTETIISKESLNKNNLSNKSTSLNSSNDNSGNNYEYYETNRSKNNIHNIVYYEDVENKAKSERDTNEIEEFTRKLTEFFIEFVEGEQYCELRFLGMFKSEEVDVVNDFVNHFSCTDENCIDKRLKEIDEALRINKMELSVKEDCNGSVYLLKKEDLNLPT